MWRDWGVKTIDETCEVLDYLRVPINEVERNKRKGSIPYYGANGLQGYIDKPLFNEKLVLLAEDGGQFEEYATRPIAYRIEGPSWVNNHAHILRNKKGYDLDYIFYQLQHKNILQYITGGTRGKLNQSALKSIEVATPELEEQKAIAEVLDTVDEAIAATQAMLEKQDKIKDGLLQDLLTRGVDASGKLRTEKQKNNATIADVVGLVNHKIAIGKNPNFPYIGLEHIDKKTLYISRFGNAMDSVSSNNVFAPNDILFGKLRPNLRKCAFAENDGYCSTDILVLRANASVIPLFVLYICSSEAIFNEAIKSTEGTKMPRTSWATIKEVPVYLPDEDEQKRIVGVINAHLQKNRDTENELTKLKKLKAGLMQDLLTGKKRVPSALKEAA